MKIAVHGSYYCRNFGDTLLVKIVCDWIKESGDHEIVLPMITNDIEAQEIGARKISKEDWEDIDLVVFTGGGYFGEPNTNYLRKQLWAYRNWKRHLKWLKRVKGTNKIVLGAGFGPLSNPFFRKRVFNLFEECSNVYLRDNESINWVKSYGYSQDNIVKTIDLAFSLGLNKGTEISKPVSRKLGIHIPVSDSKISAFYIENLLPILQDDFEIELICDSPSQAKLLQKEGSFFYECNKVKNIKVAAYPGCQQLVEQLKGYSAIITSKLHVGIVATNLGIPVYAMPRHIKTTRYYQQIGYHSNCNPIYDFDNQKHLKLIKDIFNIDKPLIKDELYLELNSMVSDFKKLLK